MTNLSIYITAYQRQAMLNALLKQLDGQDITVFDDASMPKMQAPEGIKITRARKNHGKKRYWKWINILLQKARRTKGDVMILPDDVQFIQGGFQKALDEFAVLCEQNPGPVCLNLLQDGRKMCWTRKPRRDHSGTVYATGWVDGALICNNAFLTSFGHIPDPGALRWEVDPLAGSGVWQYVSITALKMGASFFQVKKSLLLHGDHASMMHPEARKIDPINSEV